jgi:hypothetical protein
MGFAVVLPQKITAEIPVEIPPYGVDMVGLVLHVVVLDEEVRPLDAIIVGLARLQAAGPSEK